MEGVRNMKEICKKGFIIMVIYLLFAAYLLLVSNRIERLEKQDELESVNVSINYSE